MDLTKDNQSQSSEQTPVLKSTAKWLMLASIGFGAFLYSIDITIVYISLPTLAKALHTSFAIIEWVALSYLLAIAALIVLVGKLGDAFNKKFLYLGGMILFTLSSLLCGLASTANFLISFRALQGLGATFISALGAAIVTENFPVSGRGLALGIIGAISSLGVILGPTLGGLLIDLGNWRLIFFVNVPIGIATSLIVLYAVPSSVKSDRNYHFDIFGALLMTLTLSSFALAMTFGQLKGFDTLTSLSLLIIAAISFTCFLVVEVRVLEPMLDLEIFHNLKFSISLLASWIMYTVMGGVIFILPFFMELVEHYSTKKIGLLIAVLPISVCLMEPISGGLSDRFGWRISIIGLVAMVVGCFAIGTLDTDLTVTDYVFPAIVLGCGMGIFLPPNNTTIMSNVLEKHLGVASALLSLCRVLGHIVGVSVFGSLFMTLSQLRDNSTKVESLVFAEHYTFYIGACILAVALMLLIYASFQDT